MEGMCVVKILMEAYTYEKRHVSTAMHASSRLVVQLHAKDHPHLPPQKRHRIGRRLGCQNVSLRFTELLVLPLWLGLRIRAVTLTVASGSPWLSQAREDSIRIVHSVCPFRMRMDGPFVRACVRAARLTPAARAIQTLGMMLVRH